ncbi:hypothetical protein P170DRAFT_427061 [Aspergillus steynii IBT 23096]|uniref:Uncharacterized protein n=1 Tax=Aspergillus steynii IBT 23096 TaxID=1392250 RepID=A0A2I2G4S3_9EURO|nr:uncharacterized protein P170DRAFT_427061 [Aspergillus steynii IBT 23096]PLB47879.1 hypothetical protein P170DRAFT_427061 [Aspergillus steynii IBT 23096]
MQLTSILTVALSAASLASAGPLRRAKSPALTWQVSNFTSTCAQEECVYNFNIRGIETENTPGFATICSSTGQKIGDYITCANGNITALVTPESHSLRNVKAEHSWRQGLTASFHAQGATNVTQSASNFTIPVTHVFGSA